MIAPVTSQSETRALHEDPRDVVGVLVFIVGLTAFGLVPLLSMLERLI